MTSATDNEPSLTREHLLAVSSAELFDQDGKKISFEELTKGRRMILIFIRHFCEFSERSL
jgi:hypothetical protein